MGMRKPLSALLGAAICRMPSGTWWVLAQIFEPEGWEVGVLTSLAPLLTRRGLSWCPDHSPSPMQMQL